jgi:hypothetical protein
MNRAVWTLANGSTITFSGDDKHGQQISTIRVQMVTKHAHKPPMTHEERRALIEAPIGQVTTHGKATWCGGAFASDGMERARRRLHVTSFVQDDHDVYKE